MAISFSARSKAAMAGLHPNLVKVLNKAAELATKEEDFMVIEGIRSREQMIINYGKGRTVPQMIGKGISAVLAQKYAQPKAAKVTWLNDPFKSNHRLMADGFGHAFDAVPFPVDWNDTKRFDRMAALFFRAAKEVGVKIRWGADWNENGKPRERGESDSPHFEL